MKGFPGGVSGGAIDSVKREGFSSPRPSGHILSLFDELIPSDEACEDIKRKKHLFFLIHMDLIKSFVSIKSLEVLTSLSPLLL